MKIAIIGATGQTGLEFIKQALERGHNITALVRSPEKITVSDDNLRVIKGDIYNRDDICRAVAGQEAIFIALGTGKSPIKSSIREDGTRHVIEALQSLQQTSHLLIMSSLGVGDSFRQMPFYWRPVVGYWLRHALEDHNQQEQLVRDSGLPYTIMRPTNLGSKSATGKIRVTPVPQKTNVMPSVPLADVVAFGLDSLEQAHTKNRAVALTVQK